MIMRHWRSDDGARIAYSDEGAANGKVVILQHGFMSTGNANWRATGIVPRLLEANWRVIIPDARGHGDSDKPHDDALYGEPRMARDLIGLASSLDITTYCLAGYSMGAIVALLVAEQDPRVARLAVGGIGEGAVAAGGVDTRVVSQSEIVSALAAEDPSSLPAGAAAFRRAADASGGDRKAFTCQARAIHQASFAFDKIGMPTLVFAGDVDPFATKPEALVAALPCAELGLFKGDHAGVFGDAGLASSLVDFFSPHNNNASSAAAERGEGSK